MKPVLFVLAVVVLSHAYPAHADVITFDSVAVPSGTCVDATSYLAGYGVSFATSNPGATPAICSGSTTSIPVSLPNFFGALPAPGENNLPISYTLSFADPLQSISFWRVGQTSPSTGPTWTATALDSLNQVVGTPVGEPAITLNPTAQLFTIVGVDIRSLRIDANNLGVASANNPGLDDFTLVAVPEPSSLLLLVSGCAVALRRWRQRKQSTEQKQEE